VLESEFSCTRCPKETTIGKSNGANMYTLPSGNTSSANSDTAHDGFEGASECWRANSLHQVRKGNYHRQSKRHEAVYD
jgi:hypothetical protein